MLIVEMLTQPASSSLAGALLCETGLRPGARRRLLAVGEEPEHEAAEVPWRQSSGRFANA